jgi:hypothetical protein
MIFPVAFIVLFSRCAGLLNPGLVLPGLEHLVLPEKENARPAHPHSRQPQPSGASQESTPGRAIARASRRLLEIGNRTMAVVFGMRFESSQRKDSCRKHEKCPAMEKNYVCLKTKGCQKQALIYCSTCSASVVVAVDCCHRCRVHRANQWSAAYSCAPDRNQVGVTWIYVGRMANLSKKGAILSGLHHPPPRSNLWATHLVSACKVFERSVRCLP